MPSVAAMHRKIAADHDRQQARQVESIINARITESSGKFISAKREEVRTPEGRKAIYAVKFTHPADTLPDLANAIHTHVLDKYVLWGQITSAGKVENVNSYSMVLMIEESGLIARTQL